MTEWSTLSRPAAPVKRPSSYGAAALLSPGVRLAPLARRRNSYIVSRRRDLVGQSSSSAKAFRASPRRPSAIRSTPTRSPGSVTLFLTSPSAHPPPAKEEARGRACANLRRPSAPSPAKPATIIAQVEASGTAPPPPPLDATSKLRTFAPRPMVRSKPPAQGPDVRRFGGASRAVDRHAAEAAGEAREAAEEVEHLAAGQREAAHDIERQSPVERHGGRDRRAGHFEPSGLLDGFGPLSLATMVPGVTGNRAHEARTAAPRSASAATAAAAPRRRPAGQNG